MATKKAATTSNADLEAILDALALQRVDHEDGGHSLVAADHQDVDKARQLSVDYVKANPDEFADFRAWGTDKDALEKTVQAVEVFRAAGMRSQWARAEAWHFATWEPQNIGGVAQPVLRNIVGS